jgi:hypothetical protein
MVCADASEVYVILWVVGWLLLRAVPTAYLPTDGNVIREGGIGSAFASPRVKKEVKKEPQPPPEEGVGCEGANADGEEGAGGKEGEVIVGGGGASGNTGVPSR